MKLSHEYDRFRNDMKPALDSKLGEFATLGYDTVSEGELWNYLTKKKWRKTREDVRVYEVVQDILSVKVGEYMNFATVEAFKVADFAFDDEEERKALLK